MDTASPVMKKLNEGLVKDAGVRVLYAYYFGAAPATSRRKAAAQPADLPGPEDPRHPVPHLHDHGRGDGRGAALVDWSEVLTARWPPARSTARRTRLIVPKSSASALHANAPRCTGQHHERAVIGAFAVSTKVIGSSMRRAARAAGAAAAEVPARHRDAQLWRWPRWRLKKPKSDLATGTAEAWSNARNAAQRGLVRRQARRADAQCWSEAVHDGAEAFSGCCAAAGARGLCALPAPCAARLLLPLCRAFRPGAMALLWPPQRPS
ncbi:MAG: hypothetical protein U1F49_17885 [Rubrivivax sp.]